MTLRYGARVQQRPAVWLAPVRGAILAALVTLLTATGHLLGGGTLAGLSPLAVLVPLLATVLVAVAERCRGILAMLAALGAGQLVLHYLLVVLTAHAHIGPDAVFSGSAMPAAHAVATLATAVVLSRADAAVTALVAAFGRILPRRLRVAAVDVAPPACPVPDPDVPLAASLALVAAHARRGPPIAC